MATARVKLGKLEVDPLTFEAALDAITAQVNAKKGGYVFTPNVDHVVLAESREDFRLAYAGASLSLVDGTPLVWASRLLGTPTPEKISGSDLVMPLLQRAAENQWKVYLMGAAPGVAQEAAEAVRKQYPVDFVGFDSPFVTVDGNGKDESGAAIAKINATGPDLVLVALGTPKQELWIHRHAQKLAPATLLGIGASLDFIAGRVRRAPRWMSQAGLEWAFRLGQEPRRLWKRYLVQDSKFLFILAKDLSRARD